MIALIITSIGVVVALIVALLVAIAKAIFNIYFDINEINMFVKEMYLTKRLNAETETRDRKVIGVEDDPKADFGDNPYQE